MLEIIGWKRIEVNRLMRFGGVTDVNFQSILRRSFVWKPRAKFLDAKYLDAHYPNHAADGVFAEKPFGGVDDLVRHVVGRVADSSPPQGHPPPRPRAGSPIP